MSSSVLEIERVSQMVSINPHSVVQQSVSMIFLAASCILYLERNYVLPACVLVDTAIDIFRCSRSDLEIELKHTQLGSACSIFDITT